ncbi:hypothetical protein ACFV4K_27615 [Nocardia sp. NPDC059764]|uniref:hypothetical protein n=1 Tax=Nocardia sp. NPDC059764 TaxID=3346939 RepID=UPI00365E0A89
MTAAVALAEGSGAARPERRPFGPGSRMWEDTGLITFSLTADSAFLLLLCTKQADSPKIDNPTP